MMNLFRFVGDMSHLLSILVLLLRLKATRNHLGISIKTQELYLIVFIARYLDLFTTYYSLYNTGMKIIYISMTAYIIYMVRFTEPFKSNHDASQDSFLHWRFAVLPCLILAIVTNYFEGINFMEVRTICMYLCIKLSVYKALLSIIIINYTYYDHQYYISSLSSLGHFPFIWNH